MKRLSLILFIFCSYITYGQFKLPHSWDGMQLFNGNLRLPNITVAVPSADTGVAVLSPSNQVNRMNRMAFLNMIGALSYPTLDTSGANNSALVRQDRMRNTIRDSLANRLPNYVDLTSNQIITGYKTYNGITGPFSIDGTGGYTYINLQNGANYIRRQGTTYTQALRFPSSPTGNWDYYLPDNGGTLALTSDITAAVAVYGSNTQTASTGVTSYTIAHGLSGVTSSSKVFVTARTADAGGFRYIDVDATNITIYYSVSPTTGTSLKWDWEIKR